MPKADQYLLIQNHGEAPIEGYTILGYSSTRNCGVEGTIGQFGSGTKHAINLCLRNGLPVWVYCGTTRLEFALEGVNISDGLREDQVYHVIYRKNTAEKFQRAGWVSDWGVLDWDHISMALREFVSNAIDRTLREEDGIEEAKNAGRLSVKIVDDRDRRAKSDSTRVYVGLNDGVREYFGQLGKRFLHFSDKPEEAKPGLLPQAHRNCGEGQGAVIYREGVWVRELDGEALYDYNFSKDRIKLDESRNSSDYSVKAACARLVKDAEAGELAEVLRAQVSGQKTIETSFDADYMTGFGTLNETQKVRWQTAWEAAAGPGAVVCDNQFSKDYATKKGHASHAIGSNWMRALQSAGVKSALDVLNVDEQRGRTSLDATPDAQAAVDWAWELAQLAFLVGDRVKPKVFCFQQIGSAEGATQGYQNHKGVHIHIDIANQGQNNELRKTALEEVTHWITGATDNSRDFQNFLLDTVVTLCS